MEIQKSNVKVISVSIEINVIEALAQAAYERRETKSGLVNKIVKEWLEARVSE